MLSRKKVNLVLDEMEKVFPDAWCELIFQNTFELLIAVMLSARTTDKAVNKVTPSLFEKYPAPQDFLTVPVEELMQDISTIGLYRNKAKHIQECCRQLLELHQGKVPDTFEELTQLAGVGRKTANVVLSVGFNKPAIAVDTHVERVSKCFKIVPEHATPLEVEHILMKKVPKERWGQTHHLLIFWGRYRCKRSSKLKHCQCCQDLMSMIKDKE
ncbi:MULTISPECIES: endonuclease III [unclassified Granulicatella]|uniref:endonuclease III n=1 Tax=unclassified Granulicatella TaxID=2630493 RepID=UPI001073D1D7|nr:MULTISPECIES: endonuclease III [unclassified Granulicatella]MBF0779617.1 endonuclease III [Granulicatella sp. 19428wC4_WM01]TFU96416.1 endonuclease III [Granulicatella sp. WM01]